MAKSKHKGLCASCKLNCTCRAKHTTTNHPVIDNGLTVYCDNYKLRLPKDNIPGD